MASSKAWPAALMLPLLLVLGGPLMRAADSVHVMPRVDMADSNVARVVQTLRDTILRWRVPHSDGRDPDADGRPGNVAGILRNWCSPSPVVVHTFPATIMSVEATAPSTYEARTIVSAIEHSGSMVPLAVLRTTVRFASGDVTVDNPLDALTEDWKTSTVGRITYVYPPDVAFSRRRAQAAEAFIANVADSLDVLPPSSIRYVITRSRDELCRVLGLEYFAYPPTAISYPRQRTVIVGAPVEAYTHELVHLVLVDYAAAAEVVREGVATLYGGSLGATFDELLRAYATDIDPLRIPTLTQLFTEGARLQDDVYIMGAVVCDAIRRRHGINALKDLLSISSTALSLQRCAELLAMEPSDTMVTLSDLLDEALQHRGMTPTKPR